MVVETGLPEGWVPRWSRSRRRPYILNLATQIGDWSAPPGTDEEQLDLYLTQKIEASHLLIKHRESRNPKSWRQANITRSKEEARAILEKHREAIVAAAEQGRTILPDMCTTESDCSSASKAGALGIFGFGEMQDEFWQASIALKQNELSDIVESASGLHLIQRWNADPVKPKKSDGPTDAPTDAPTQGQ